MTGERNKPEVRFKGFSEDWEQSELVELAEKVSVGIATSSSKFFTSIEKGVPFIKNQDIKNGTITTKNLEAISHEFDEANKMMRIKEGDILTVRTGYPGLSAVVPESLNNAQTFTTLITRLKANSISPQFVSTFINSDLGMKQMNGMQAGGAQKNINANTLKKYIIKYSDSSKEQLKIAAFFQNLDKLLTLHQQKYNKLINLKKAMLVKMFPKEGADVPEIRFKGFTYKWEESELANKVEFYSGLTYSPSDVCGKGGTFVIRSSNIKNGEIVDADNVYVDSEVVNSMNVREGDVIVVVRNGSRSLIGKHARVKKSMPNVVIGAFMTGIRSENPTFINSLLSSFQFDKQVEENLGATINQITTGVFKKMRFMFPKENEQDQIGNYFENLDNLITQYQRQLIKLKNIKKACLEKMFV